MSQDKPARAPPKPRLPREVITVVRKLPAGRVRLAGGVTVRLGLELRRSIGRMARELRHGRRP